MLEKAATMFGPFLKYHNISVPERRPPVINAFSVLMHNSELISQPELPPFVPERNKKDKLYNDVLKLFEGRTLFSLLLHSDQTHKI